MKLTKFLKPAKRLDARGIAHLTVPLMAIFLIAVAGTITLVASHANPAPHKRHTAVHHSAKPKSSKPKVSKPGKLVLYNGSGVYNRAKIELEGNPSFQHKCPKAINPGQPQIVKWNIRGSKNAGGAGLPVTTNKPKSIPCSPVSNNGVYKISFGQGNNFQNPTPVISLDVDKNYCTLVFPNHPEQTNKVAEVNGKCQLPANPNDTPPKVNVVVNVKPKLITRKSNIAGFIEVKAADGTGLTRAQCTGEITAQYTSVKYDRAVSQNFPIKYTNPKNGGVSYCVAKLKKFANLAYSEYVVYGIEKGTAYFNPAQGSTTVNVTGPQKGDKSASHRSTTKKHNNGGASFPSRIRNLLHLYW